MNAAAAAAFVNNMRRASFLFSTKKDTLASVSSRFRLLAVAAAVAGAARTAAARTAAAGAAAGAAARIGSAAGLRTGLRLESGSEAGTHRRRSDCAGRKGCQSRHVGPGCCCTRGGESYLAQVGLVGLTAQNGRWHVREHKARHCEGHRQCHREERHWLQNKRHVRKTGNVAGKWLQNKMSLSLRALTWPVWLAAAVGRVLPGPAGSVAPNNT